MFTGVISAATLRQEGFVEENCESLVKAGPARVSAIRIAVLGAGGKMGRANVRGIAGLARRRRV